MPSSEASSEASCKGSSRGRTKEIPRESPKSSEGLQIAEPEPYPEAVNRYSVNRDTKLPQIQDHSNADEASTRIRTSQERTSYRPGPRSDQSKYGPTVEVPPDMVKKFFAHRRRKFIFIVIFTLFIVGALIGSSIGGALYVQDKAVQSAGGETTSSTSNGPPTPTATATATGTSSDNQDYGPTYTALPFGAIQSINATCPSTLLVSSRLQGKTSDISGRYMYSCLDSTNILDEPNLMAFTAYTLEQCVDACSQYSALSQTNKTCKAAVVNANFRHQYETGSGANCWLKSAAENASTGKAGYTAAVLREE
ncbi:hypothetical protein ACJQWK_01148 [Exserohilum turcicum]|uniref:Apple domain-containing protein n=1 Tax=Exserohilum turcicum (strain 28A) TaxID=671987 RepID=R0IFF1_EXST2|nr:uncharacterized protein SETTUDRAFT_93134 [Exserohilum turcica Et28A]EOA83796.1 hypothetical protein SETTUDRAFT_93134 [Exserohilum turcica Et28A]